MRTITSGGEVDRHDHGRTKTRCEKYLFFYFYFYFFFIPGVFLPSRSMRSSDKVRVIIG
jgi:hypothetical protein